MQKQSQTIDDLGFCPSFNCYYSDCQASTAANTISKQLQQQQQQHDRFHNVDEDEFQFSLLIGDEVISSENIDFDGRTVFPLFNRDLMNQNEADRDTERGKLEEEEEIVCSNSLSKLLINERDELVSSSEEDEPDGEAPGAFCVWRHKTDAGASPLSRCKKSSSTGTGSKRWRIRDLLRRSNSEGKEPIMLLSHKKVEIPKRKVNSGEVFTVAGKSKASVHEVFYVQQRAKREVVKRKSYLPYRQGLVGFFSNANGIAKKLPF